MALQRVPCRNRRKRKVSSRGPPCAADYYFGIESRSNLRQGSHHPPPPLVLTRLQIGVDLIVGRMQFFCRLTLAPRSRGRRHVAVDGFLPVTRAGECV